jgi:hypothetical protein
MNLNDTLADLKLSFGGSDRLPKDAPITQILLVIEKLESFHLTSIMTLESDGFFMIRIYHIALDHELFGIRTNEHFYAVMMLKSCLWQMENPEQATEQAKPYIERVLAWEKAQAAGGAR